MKTLLPTIAMTFASISIASFPAKAAVLQYSGNFSVTYDTLSSSYQGVPQISGTWSFTFDDVAVPATGTYDTPTPIAISAINMTPSQIGTTTIDITNSGRGQSSHGNISFSFEHNFLTSEGPVLLTNFL